MTKFKVQDSHSRNGHDWKVEVDTEGRIHLNANGKGVYLRMEKVALYLNKLNNGAHHSAILNHLQKVHGSYTDNDLNAVAKQFKKHGIAKIVGRGKEATWKLTPKGRSICTKWSKTTKPEWV